MTSIFGMMGVDLAAPDHTTLSRRGHHLSVTLRPVPAQGGLHLIVDSTGLSIMGEGEWAGVKHGGNGRRGWKKLHLGVDETGVIVARALTAPTADDAITGLSLVEHVDRDLTRVTAEPGRRHPRLLRRGRYARRTGRGAADQGRVSVSQRAPFLLSRSYDQAGERSRSATVEEGFRIPPASPCGKRVLPVQVDHWRRSSSAQSGGTADGIRSRVQHPEPDDRAREAGLIPDRQVIVPTVEIVWASSDPRNNAVRVTSGRTRRACARDPVFAGTCVARDDPAVSKCHRGSTEEIREGPGTAGRLTSGHPPVIRPPHRAKWIFPSGARKSLKRMVPEVGVEPTRSVSSTGF